MREQIFRCSNVNLSFLVGFCSFYMLQTCISLNQDVVYIPDLFFLCGKETKMLKLKMSLVKTSSLIIKKRRILFKVCHLYSASRTQLFTAGNSFSYRSCGIHWGNELVPSQSSQVCVRLQNAEQSASNFHHQDLWQWNSHQAWSPKERLLCLRHTRTPTHTHANKRSARTELIYKRR